MASRFILEQSTRGGVSAQSPPIVTTNQIMRNIIILMMMILGMGFINAQELSKEALKLRGGNDTQRQVYQDIKNKAQEGWPDDFNMQVYEINKQTKAVIKYLEYHSEYEGNNKVIMMLIKAALEWGAKYENDQFVMKGLDWNMAIYTFERNLKAYKAINND